MDADGRARTRWTSASAGGDYPGTTSDFGQAGQLAQQQNCTSPVGDNPQYCATLVNP